MTPNILYSAFQRLEPGRDGPLDYAYMGVAEYEGGVCAAALNALVSGIAPLETIETRLALTDSDLPISARDLTRGTPEVQARTRAERDVWDLMADGRSLRLTHIPEVSGPEGLDALMGAASAADIRNRGGFVVARTRAWLALSPVIGVLFHPAQEGCVADWLTQAQARREAQIADPEDRVLDALRGLRTHSLGDPGFVNQGIRDIMTARAAEAFSL